MSRVNPSPAELKFDEGRLMQVLVAPIVSEKATMVADKSNSVTFKVLQCATKPEIGIGPRRIDMHDRQIALKAVSELQCMPESRHTGGRKICRMKNVTDSRRGTVYQVRHRSSFLLSGEICCLILFADLSWRSARSRRRRLLRPITEPPCRWTWRSGATGLGAVRRRPGRPCVSSGRG